MDKRLLEKALYEFISSFHRGFTPEDNFNDTSFIEMEDYFLFFDYALQAKRQRVFMNYSPPVLGSMVGYVAPYNPYFIEDEDNPFTDVWPLMEDGERIDQEEWTQLNRILQSEGARTSFYDQFQEHYSQKGPFLNRIFSMADDFLDVLIKKSQQKGVHLEYFLKIYDSITVEHLHTSWPFDDDRLFQKWTDPTAFLSRFPDLPNFRPLEPPFSLRDELLKNDRIFPKHSEAELLSCPSVKTIILKIPPKKLPEKESFVEGLIKDVRDLYREASLVIAMGSAAELLQLAIPDHLAKIKEHLFSISCFKRAEDKVAGLKNLEEFTLYVWKKLHASCAFLHSLLSFCYSGIERRLRNQSLKKNLKIIQSPTDEGQKMAETLEVWEILVGLQKKIIKNPFYTYRLCGKPNNFMAYLRTMIKNQVSNRFEDEIERLTKESFAEGMYVYNEMDNHMEGENDIAGEDNIEPKKQEFLPEHFTNRHYTPFRKSLRTLRRYRKQLKQKELSICDPHEHNPILGQKEFSIERLGEIEIYQKDRMKHHVPGYLTAHQIYEGFKGRAIHCSESSLKNKLKILRALKKIIFKEEKNGYRNVFLYNEKDIPSILKKIEEL